MAIRAAYSKAEEDELALFLATNPGPRDGKVLYQEFARNHPSHSWQSWRAHYRSDRLKMDAVIRRIQRELRSKNNNSVQRKNHRKDSSRLSPHEIEFMNVDHPPKAKGKGKASPVDFIEIDCDSDTLQTCSRMSPTIHCPQEFNLHRIVNERRKYPKWCYKCMDQECLSCPSTIYLNPLDAQLPVIIMSREEEQSFFEFVSSYPEGDLRLCLKFYENYHLKADKFSPTEYRTYYLAHRNKIQNFTSQHLAAMQPASILNFVNKPELPHKGQEDEEPIQLDDDNILLSKNQKTRGLVESVDGATLEIDTLSVSSGSVSDLDLDYLLTCQNHSELESTMILPNNLLKSFLGLKDNPFHCPKAKVADPVEQNHSTLLENTGTRRLNDLLPLECQREFHEDSTSVVTSDTVIGCLPSTEISSPQHLKDLPQLVVDHEELDKNIVLMEMSDSVEEHHLPLPVNESPKHSTHPLLPLEDRHNLQDSTVGIEMSGFAEGRHILLPEDQSSRDLNGFSQLVEGQPEPQKTKGSAEKSDSIEKNDTLNRTDEILEDLNNLSDLAGGEEELRENTEEHQSKAAQVDPHESRISILKRKFSYGGLYSSPECGSNQDKATSTAVESPLPSSGKISRKSSFKPAGPPRNVEEAVELMSIFMADFSDLYTPPEAVHLFQQCGDWALMFEVATLKKVEKELKEAPEETNATKSKTHSNDSEVDLDYASRIQSMVWTHEEDALIKKTGSSQMGQLPELQSRFHQLVIKRGAQAVQNRRAFLASIDE